MTTVAAPRLAPAPSLPRLFAIELRKTIDTRAGFWLLVSSALAAIGVAAVTLAAGTRHPVTFGLLLERTVGTTSIALPILGILAITSEWSQRTAVTTFALVPRRERVIGAKLLAGAAVALAAVAVCVLRRWRRTRSCRCSATPTRDGTSPPVVWPPPSRSA